MVLGAKREGGVLFQSFVRLLRTQVKLSSSALSYTVFFGGEIPSPSPPEPKRSEKLSLEGCASGSDFKQPACPEEWDASAGTPATQTLIRRLGLWRPVLPSGWQVSDVLP